MNFSKVNTADIQNALNIKDLAVNGHDLVSIGLSGKQIGDTLNFLLDNVLDNPELNNKESLLSLIKRPF